MTKDDVLFGYRLQLFDLAARTSVAHACRTFGVHRSTYYRWKGQVERSGLEMLRPRERRRPAMPNQFPAVVEERIVGFSLGHPGLGPRRVAPSSRDPNGARCGSRPMASGRCCAATASTPGPSGWRWSPATERPMSPAGARAEPQIDTQRPGELVGFDCFFVGRLHGTKGTVWQLSAIDTYSSFAWAELVRCPDGAPDQNQTAFWQDALPRTCAPRGGAWNGC